MKNKYLLIVLHCVEAFRRYSWERKEIPIYFTKEEDAKKEALAIFQTMKMENEKTLHGFFGEIPEKELENINYVFFAEIKELTL